jgi:hypothetical protein
MRGLEPKGSQDLAIIRLPQPRKKEKPLIAPGAVKADSSGFEQELNYPADGGPLSLTLPESRRAVH